jgi:hypothetical protein
MTRVEAAARETVRALGRELRSERRWGLPWYVGQDLVLTVNAFTKYVEVEFWRGATLARTHKTLEGTGKNLRHVRLRTLSDATSPTFLALVRDAIALDAATPPRPR